MHKRPPPQSWRPEPDGSLLFMETKTESEYKVDKGGKPYAELRVWGVTKSRHSVVLVVTDFKAYFYVDLPEGIQPVNIVRYINAQMAREYPKEKTAHFVVDTSYVQRKNIDGYKPPGEGMMNLLKITMSSPKYIGKVRDFLEDGVLTNGRRCPTYEANVVFVMRFMVDIKLNGCQWLRVPKSAYEVCRDTSESGQPLYRTSLAFICKTWQELVAVPYDEEESLGPWRWLSYDIEACRYQPGFPKATEDPITQVCFVLEEQGRGIICKRAFCLAPYGGGCNAIFGIELSVYAPVDPTASALLQAEARMLQDIQKFVLECDYDFITGWNVDKFDNPYMFRDRPRTLGVQAIMEDVGRILDKKAYIRQKTIKSRAYGTIKTTEMVAAGRSCYDGYMHTRLRERMSVRSYTLNNVANFVLKQSKVDVPHWQIPVLQKGTDSDRQRLTYYCMVDAELPLKILHKRMAMENGAEQARVTGIDFAQLLGGEGKKTFCKLLRTLPDYHMTIPSAPPSQNDEKTKGGHVFKPIFGYYVKRPVVTADFKSLYPSIMEAYNVGYDSYCSLEWAQANLKPTDYNIPPYIEDPTYCFVRPHIHRSIMAQIVHDLLAARAQAKAELKKETDPERKKVLDARQLALKLCCNSVYGFFKAHYLCNKDCMEAVTAWGRYMIELTERVICDHFTPEHTRRIHADAPKAMNLVYAYMQANLNTDPRIPKPSDDDHSNDAAGGASYWGYSVHDLKNAGWWRPAMQIHFARDIVDEDAKLVYGDTDSVMITFGKMSPERAWYLGERASFLATCYFEHPNELECEAVKQPSIFIKKKGYIVRERESATAKGKVKVQGESAKRRDNFPLVAELQWQCSELLLQDASDDGPDIISAIELVHSTCKRLLQCRVDISKLVMSQTFSKTLEEYEEGGTRPAHVELWKKKAARAHKTGEYLESTGDRVPYVVMPEVNTGTRKAKKFTRVEDPEYCMRKGLYPDPLWYIEQLKKPLLRLFSPVFTGDLDEWVTPETRHHPLIEKLFEVRQTTMAGEFDRTQERVTQKVASSEKRLRRLMAHRLLFEGPHMQVRVHRSIRMEREVQEERGRKTSLASFVVKGKRCLSCQVVMRPQNRGAPNSGVCQDCAPQSAQVYQELIREVDHKQRLFNQAWTRCQRCQGSFHKEVVCGNRDCDNFYHRISLRTDIEDLVEKMQRFE